MTPRERQLRAGRWLFRWRSWVPLTLMPVFFASTQDHQPLLDTAGHRLAWQLACLAIALLGLAVRVHVVGHAPRGTSGRNRHEQKAESLTTTGWYSVVRHPLYLGNGLMLLGVSLLTATWYLPVIVVLGAGLHYGHIVLVEETYLAQRFGDAYHRWAARTPAIVPGRARWRAPALPFSWRVALRAEIYATFALIATITALDAAQRWSATGQFRPSAVWTPLCAATAVLWVTVRALRKRTNLLSVEGR